MKNILSRLSVFAMVIVGSIVPTVARAQNSVTDLDYNSSEGLVGIAGFFYAALKFVIPILITLAVVYFIWGVIKYVRAGSEADQAEARKEIVQGVVALFVIVSIWGLVAILQNTFDVQGGQQNQSDIVGDNTISDPCQWTDEC